MAEYPTEYELDVVLRDGGGARIRPIRPDDGAMELVAEPFQPAAASGNSRAASSQFRITRRSRSNT